MTILIQPHHAAHVSWLVPTPPKTLTASLERQSLQPSSSWSIQNVNGIHQQSRHITCCAAYNNWLSGSHFDNGQTDDNRTGKSESVVVLQYPRPTLADGIGRRLTDHGTFRQLDLAEAILARSRVLDANYRCRSWRSRVLHEQETEGRRNQEDWRNKNKLNSQSGHTHTPPSVLPRKKCKNVKM